MPVIRTAKRTEPAYQQNVLNRLAMAVETCIKDIYKVRKQAHRDCKLVVTTT